MRWLSDLVGTPVAGVEGAGRLRDLVGTLDDGPPRVGGVLAGAGRRPVRRPVIGLASGGVLAGTGPASTPDLAPGDLLLRRDVLDAAIVDAAGGRGGRVADVLLADVGAGRVEVVGIDLGLGSVLRRLGLRRAAARLPVDLVDLTDLHLTSTRGHAVQTTLGAAGLRSLDADGLAVLLTRLSVEHAHDVTAAVPDDLREEAWRLLHPHVRARLSRTAPRRHLRTHGWRLHLPPPRRP